jgi:hypothetical protein
MKQETYRSPWFDLEGCLACTVKYSDGSKGTVLQHREVMEQVLGRKLKPQELVHHKNSNKRDNSPTNLKITSRPAHAAEHAKTRVPELLEVTCLECGKTSLKLARQVRHNQIGQQKPGPFCGRSCAGRFNGRKRI